MMMALPFDQILNGLFTRYTQRVPVFTTILDAMITQKMIKSISDIDHDHIAFRTLGVPHLGIKSLEKLFLYHGYIRRDAYHFTQKKLDAFWYAPPNHHWPRVFISELRVNDLSSEAQTIIHHYTDPITQDPVANLSLSDPNAVDAFLHSSNWDLPTWDHYKTLLDESEYAAWAIYNRYYLNHFTIGVHALPAPYNTLNTFNVFLEDLGARLNSSGGKIKTSQDGLLRQSATVAQQLSAPFTQDAHRQTYHTIAGSYVEFAERLPLPEFEHNLQCARHQRRDGFDTQNANTIFESTFRDQVQG